MQLEGARESKARRVVAEEGFEAPARAAPAPPPPPSGLAVALQERLTALVSRQGQVRELGVDGKLSANCAARVAVQLQLEGDCRSPKFRFRSISQPNRGRLWNEHKKLVYDNVAKPGEATMLAWLMSSTDLADLPVVVSCWVPQSTQDGSTFACEAELRKRGWVCENVVVTVQLGNVKRVRVAQCDGEAAIVEGDACLRWSFGPLSDENQKAEIEFSVAGVDEDSFYPVTVSFVGSQIICPIDVTAAIPVSDDAGDIPELVVTKRLTTVKYEIE
jgi:hypothetical protein